MTIFEILSLMLALGALVVSLLAYSRATSALRSRDQVEAYIRDQQQTDIQVLFLKMDEGKYNFTLANRGGSVARNIQLTLLDDVPASASPVTSAAAQLPVRQLDAGAYVQIPVDVHDETPRNFRLKVSWMNAGGLETDKEVPLNLLD
jgi:hypothetical protein